MMERNSGNNRTKLDDLDSLSAEMIHSITDDTECVRAALVNTTGLIHISGEREREIVATVGLGVTDRRLVFVTPAGGGHDVASIPYHELAGVDYDSGARMLDVTDRDGDRWRYELQATHLDVVQATVRHLEWLGSIRGSVVACASDVELAAGKVREFADGMQWEDGIAVYEACRDRLDRLISLVQLTEPIADEVLAPELTPMERTLEEAHVRLYVERVRSDLELASYLVENEEYERADSVLAQAREFHALASGQRDAVERVDAFEFGTQRDLKAAIQSLSWELDTVLAEPIRQAHEARIQAKIAATDTAVIDHLETAYERYSTLVALDWDFGHAAERIDSAEATVGKRLVDLHNDQAQVQWNRGIERHETGDHRPGLAACLAARDHAERALQLALAHDNIHVESLATRLDEMNDTISTLRSHPTGSADASGPSSDRTSPSGTSDVGRTTGDDVDAASEPGPSRPDDGTARAASGSVAGDRSVASIDDARAIDTHHDITLDLVDLTVEPTLGATADGTDTASLPDDEKRQFSADEDSATEATDALITDAVDGTIDRVIDSPRTDDPDE